MIGLLGSQALLSGNMSTLLVWDWNIGLAIQQRAIGELAMAHFCKGANII